MNPLTKLFKQFSHFFVGFLLTQCVGIVSFPILTRLLTKDQYGILGLVTTTMMVAVAIAKAGLADGVIRFYRECGDSPELLTEFASTVLIRGMFLAAGTAFAYLFVFPYLGNFFGVKEEYFFCFMIMGIYLVIRPINIIVMYFLRVNDQTIFLNAINFIERFVSFAIGLFCLLYLIHDFYGYFIGIILTEGIIAIILYQWFFNKFTINLRKTSKKLNVKLLRFGVPLCFSELSYLFMTYADRYLVMFFFNEEILGVYSVGYNLALYIGNIIIFPLSYAIVPIYVEIFEKEGKGRTEEFLKKVLHYFIMAVIPIFFGYWAVSKELLITLATEKYSEAAPFSPIILGGILIYSMSSILNAGLYLQKRTSILLLIMVCAFAMNISMNYFLIPRYGYWGGAFAVVCTSILVVLLTAILSSKFIIIRVEKPQILYYLTLSIGMYLAVDFIHFQNAWTTLFTKLGVGGLIIGLGIIYHEKDLFKKMRESLPAKKMVDNHDIGIRTR